MTIRKRFIAGAVCPACQQQDSLLMWREQQADASHTGSDVADSGAADSGAAGSDADDSDAAIGYVDIVECVKCGHQMRRREYPTATDRHNWQQQLITTRMIDI